MRSIIILSVYFLIFYINIVLFISIISFSVLFHFIGVMTRVVRRVIHIRLAYILHIIKLFFRIFILLFVCVNIFIFLPRTRYSVDIIFHFFIFWNFFGFLLSRFVKFKAVGILDLLRIFFHFIHFSFFWLISFTFFVNR